MDVRYSHAESYIEEGNYILTDHGGGGEEESSLHIQIFSAPGRTTLPQLPLAESEGQVAPQTTVPNLVVPGAGSAGGMSAWSNAGAGSTEPLQPDAIRAWDLEKELAPHRQLPGMSQLHRLLHDLLGTAWFRIPSVCRVMQARIRRAALQDGLLARYCQCLREADNGSAMRVGERVNLLLLEEFDFVQAASKARQLPALVRRARILFRFKSLECISTELATRRAPPLAAADLYLALQCRLNGELEFDLPYGDAELVTLPVIESAELARAAAAVRAEENSQFRSKLPFMLPEWLRREVCGSAFDPAAELERYFARHDQLALLQPYWS